ncbi:MAG: hypothetical protein NXH82_11440 [Rhodobacteraceae bacterium]|nr:hypothetical protein [Paracoccaceae bacterium]
MSDPVSRVEIEDVLSSIRRLVSENSRAEAVKPDAPAAGNPEKLVLTSEHRVGDAPSRVPDNVVEMAKRETPAAQVAEPEDAPMADEIGALGRKIEALEAAIDAGDAAWEGTLDRATAPQGPRVTETATQTPVQADDAKAEAVDAETEADDPNADAPRLAGETVMDEDALRDLVTDIVRRELQGALGERITRNVRKMVRREIQMALTARDFGQT